MFRIRNNRKELKKEIQAVKDRMDQFDVESEEHEKCHKQYCELLDREKDLKSEDTMRSKIVVSAVAGIGGLFAYRAIFDRSGDPLFRDMGRSILDFVKKL